MMLRRQMTNHKFSMLTVLIPTSFQTSIVQHVMNVYSVQEMCSLFQVLTTFSAFCDNLFYSPSKWILMIPYIRHVSNVEVGGTTGCSPLSRLVTNRRLQLFGHTARSSPREDHHQALAACIRQVPPNCKRPAGRPSHAWLRTIEADLGPLNFGLATAWSKATTRDEWRHIVDTAMLQRSTL